jgi:undecaprenyl-diphosphatase
MRGLLAERTPGLDQFTKLLNHLAGSQPLRALVVVGMVLWLLRTRRWQPVVTLLAAPAGSEFASTVLKGVFGRPRPDPSRWLMMAHGSSMPSDVAAAVAGACVAAVLVSRGLPERSRRGIAAVAMLLTLVAGVSVVYVGVHWPTDVLAGWLLGALVAVAIDRGVRLIGGALTAARTSDAVVDAEEAGTADRLHAS